MTMEGSFLPTCTGLYHVKPLRLGGCLSLQLACPDKHGWHAFLCLSGAGRVSASRGFLKVLSL